MIVLYCIAIEYFQIDISANHWGHFELKLCPTNGKSHLATQECEFMMMMSLTKMMHLMIVLLQVLTNTLWCWLKIHDLTSSMFLLILQRWNDHHLPS